MNAKTRFFLNMKTF